MYQAGVHQLRGEPKAVLELSSRAMAIANRREHTYGEVWRWSSIRHGWAVAHLGDPEAGVREMADSLAANRASGSQAARAHFLSLQAGVLLDLDWRDQARSVIEEALETIHATGSWFYLSEALRLQGELLLRNFPAALDEATSLFVKGLEVARSQKCRGFELRLLSSLVRHTARSRENPWRAELAGAFLRFTQGQETRDLREARSLLGTLSTATAG
jgi:predicted ATPase